jgi:hypothetical protein
MSDPPLQDTDDHNDDELLNFKLPSPLPRKRPAAAQSDDDATQQQSATTTTPRRAVAAPPPPRPKIMTFFTRITTDTTHSSNSFIWAKDSSFDAVMWAPALVLGESTMSLLMTE